jgi:hypothetical protein
MTQTTLTFEEIDALLVLIEHHTKESWHEMVEITGYDVGICRDLYDKLTEMQDEV